MTSACHPVFSHETQRWHWWAQPGEVGRWVDDEPLAKPLPTTIDWSLSEDEGQRRWEAVVDTLPGFAPFLWNIDQQHLWLARPEGVWKTPLPLAWQDQDRAVLYEKMPRSTQHRTSLLVVPDHDKKVWHTSGGRGGVDRKDLDGIALANVWIGQRPSLMGDHRRDKFLRSPVVVIPTWSEPGPCTFELAKATFDPSEGEEDALIIVLPNGVPVVESLTVFPMRRLVEEHRLVIELGEGAFTTYQQSFNG